MRWSLPPILITNPPAYPPADPPADPPEVPDGVIRYVEHRSQTGCSFASWAWQNGLVEVDLEEPMKAREVFDAAAFAAFLPPIHEIFGGKQPRSWIEALYYRTFQASTSEGEHARGAHLRAVEAVYKAGQESVQHPRLRDSVARRLERAAKWLMR